MSVIIATYNRSEVLRYAVASVLHQTYRHFELLVIGDGCTDDSEAVVSSFHDPRVHWHNRPVNSGGQSAPHNTGIERSRGEIIAYLGHDDLWLPTHLARIVTALEQSGAAAAYAVGEAIGPPGSNVRMLNGLSAWSPNDTRVLTPNAPSASLFAHRREAIEEIGQWRDYRTLVQPPDTDFVCRLARSSRGIVPVGVLTVCKFSASWRRDSYRLRESDEQAAYSARMRHERLFVARELAAIAWLRLRQRPGSVPMVEGPPEVVPPGWYVTQLRRIRGLPDDPTSSAETPASPPPP